MKWRLFKEAILYSAMLAIAINCFQRHHGGIAAFYSIGIGIHFALLAWTLAGLSMEFKKAGSSASAALD